MGRLRRARRWGADSKLPTPAPRSPGSSCPRLLPRSDPPSTTTPPLPFLPPPSPPFSYPQGAPTLGKNVPSLRTLAMVTAHPHPRAPQRPGLARRAARKGGVGASQPRGHTSTAPVATVTGGVSKCAAAKWHRALLSLLHPSNPPAEDPGS